MWRHCETLRATDIGRDNATHRRIARDDDDVEDVDSVIHSARAASVRDIVRTGRRLRVFEVRRGLLG